MRTLITTICLMLVVSATRAQEESTRIFKPFKVDLSAGFALPLGGGSGATKGGVLVALEPKYALADKFALGLRLELAAMARAYIDNSGNSVSGDGSANGSIALTGDYYFTNNRFRPFIGAGVGNYTITYASVSSGNGPNDLGSDHRFGFMARAGFEYRHFRVGVEYNIVGSTTVSPDNNYLGFKIGGFFGGGRKVVDVQQ
jgi:outer membrane protein X